MKAAKSEQYKEISSRQPVKDSRWFSNGLDAAYYQRSVQVNWTSVLAGIPIGILATQISPVIEALKTPDWYPVLYFSLLILAIAYSWLQVSWGSLVLKWAISVFTTLFGLISFLALSFSALNISRPDLFTAGLSVAILVSLGNQLYFYFSGSWNTFDPQYAQRLKNSLWIYLAQILLTCGATVMLFLIPSAAIKIIWGFIGNFACIGAILFQYIGMVKEKEELNIP